MKNIIIVVAIVALLAGVCACVVLTDIEVGYLWKEIRRLWSLIGDSSEADEAASL